MNYVSVKISAVCAGVSALAFDSTVDRVADRLRELYREAAAFDPPKFVNLDMEEYCDLALTIAAFERVLDEPEFGALDAGVVLQAYLPDTQVVARRSRNGRRPAVGGRAEPSRCESSKAPIWRWRQWKQNCTVGDRPPMATRPMSTPTTRRSSMCCSTRRSTMPCELASPATTSSTSPGR